MNIKTLQSNIRKSTESMETPWRNSQEIILSIVEELGEVSTEIALIEKIGTKSQWERKPSIERLKEETTHLLNLIISLANYYKIDLDEITTGGLENIK